MLSSMANAKRAGIDWSSYLTGLAQQQQQLQQRNITLQDLINHQYAQQNVYYNSQIRQGQTLTESQELLLRRVQVAREIENLKKILQRPTSGNTTQHQWMLPLKPQTPIEKPKPSFPNFVIKKPVDMATITDEDISKIEEDEGLGMKCGPDSPPSTPLSQVSSGVGTLATPFSDIDSPPDFPELKSGIEDSAELPDKDLDEYFNAMEEEKQAVTPPKTKIMYQGRNILDLYHNMTYQWQFQTARLPPQSAQTHYEYRALYHRLGPFGLIDDFDMAQCPYCEFQYPVPKAETA